MARRISTGVQGKNVLGSIVAVNNTLQSVIANDDVVLQPSGTGISSTTKDFEIQNGNNLRLGDDDNSAYVALTAPATVASNLTLTLPGTDGSNGQFLSTDGSGVLSWGTAVQTVTDIISGSTTHYPLMSTSTSGTISGVNTSSSKLSYVPASGTLTATALVESSSITLKENVAPITNALESVLKLEGVTYDRKDKSYLGEAGLIAEEVNKVLPNLVTKDENGKPYAINYTKFSAYLIEAVKDLSSQIDKLKQAK